MNFKGKKVTVVGLGKSGFAAAKFLAAQKSRVRVTDASDAPQVLERAQELRRLGVEAETGRHTQAFLKGSELFVTSPGVSKKSLPLSFARRKKTPILSEVELASYFCRGLIVGVTGSNGKTTTCHLLHRIFLDAGKKSVLCGNVGYSFLDALPAIDSKTLVVLELSSFQLEDCIHFRPTIAVILNISPNHLDRHGSLASYARAKEKIFMNQTKKDTLLLNADDERVRRMAARAASRVVFFSKKSKTFDTSRLPLKGEHNRENILAAASAARLLGISAAAIERTLHAFKTLEHRLEFLGNVGGVDFVNDSKSTTLASTRAAILAMTKPVILVAGGRDKGVDFEAIEAILKDKVKRAVLYGESREKMAAAWKSFSRFELCEHFGEAVKLAHRRGEAGDVLLLSPMATSFDQFHSYEERGEAFKKIFKELKGTGGNSREG